MSATCLCNDFKQGKRGARHAESGDMPHQNDIMEKCRCSQDSLYFLLWPEGRAGTREKAVDRHHKAAAPQALWLKRRTETESAPCAARTVGNSVARSKIANGQNGVKIWPEMARSRFCKWPTKWPAFCPLFCPKMVQFGAKNCLGNMLRHKKNQYPY